MEGRPVGAGEAPGPFQRAGAKYFAAMANHHDNFDMFDSKYQPWNSVAIGPKKDMVGGWAKAARAVGLRLAVSCHGDRAWSWLQDSQRADTSGPLAGVTYDGRLAKADGKGLWWDGLDPQDLYAQYHPIGRYNWQQTGNPPLDKAYCEKFFNRTIDLIDKYKTPKQVVQMLIDIVSKNGNLMLSVPVRGNGTIDEDEVACLEGIAKWIAPNGEGIFATRPWKVYGEGPSVTTQAPRGQFGGARDVRPYTAEDMRFTSKGNLLFAFVMAWPEGAKVTLKSLAQGSENYPKAIARVELLGSNGPQAFARDTTGLVVTLPEQKPNAYAYALKITPA
jgi:alpha-L-fucosidase